MGDEDKAVLAGRVLSYLKRKFGHGSQPSADETKAAIAAAKLLSAAFPTEAKDPAKMFEKLTQVSRGNGTGSDLDTMRMQIYMQKQSQMYDMLSNIMKIQGDTTKSFIGNLR